MLNKKKTVIFFCLIATLFSACQKEKIACETDAECEEMLVGVWEDNPGFITKVFIEFKEDGAFHRYHGVDDYMNGVNSSVTDSTTYSVKNFTVEILNKNGTTDATQKIISLTNDQFHYKDVAGSGQLSTDVTTYKRIK